MNANGNRLKGSYPRRVSAAMRSCPVVMLLPTGGCLRLLPSTRRSAPVPARAELATNCSQSVNQPPPRVLGRPHVYQAVPGVSRRVGCVLVENGADIHIWALINTVRAAARTVYKILGKGRGEALYEKALEVELRLRNCGYDRQRTVIVKYRGHQIATRRLDLVVENRLILELKSRGQATPPNEESVRQLRDYTRICRLPGLLIRFAGDRPNIHLVIGEHPPVTLDSHELADDDELDEPGVVFSVPPWTTL